MTDKEAMKLALFAFDIVKIHFTQNRHMNEAITALKERLAQPEQEPVVCRFCRDERGCWAWQCDNCGEIDDSLEVPPPQRTWVGLTDGDLAVCGSEDDVLLARYWERVCKEKNT